MDNHYIRVENNMLIKIAARCGRGVAARLLLLCLLSLIFSTPVNASGPSLLSDRAAHIVNTAPFTSGPFIIPGGLSGKGEIIGLADSGLDKGSLDELHPDLAGETGQAPRIAKLQSVSGRAIPSDPSGHGTHMAGILVGSGQASQGKYRGIAPGSSLYFQALLDQQDRLVIPSSLSSLYNPAYLEGVRVYVNGWGNSGNVYRSSSRQIDAFVAEHPDFLPIFGAGNSGPDSGTLTMEANSKNALVVGASQAPRPALDMKLADAGQILSSSSRGPAADGRIKPELLAPGSNIIAACSAMVQSNFTPNPSYTAMSGTSMAAAVTGGTVALLREYLDAYRHLDNPSAALIKALLINGARLPESGAASSHGFGILDLAGTILPVRDRTVEFINQAGISAGQTREYHINIDQPGVLFKATLAWTDPAPAAGAAGALVNNLDLVVKDPAGKLYRGNDFSRSGQADAVNNVEQVSIPNAAAGVYTVEVTASYLDPAYTQQSYALVYGEALQHDTVVSNAGGKIVLSSGQSYSGLLEYDQSKMAESGHEVNSPVGGELYWHGHKAYLLLQSWESAGVQMLAAPAGNLIMEANPRTREGGYYLTSGDLSAQILVNGAAIDDSSDFPVGAHIKAAVNPLHQVLWQARAQARSVEGYIKRVDMNGRQIWLINDDQPYRIYPGAAINVNNNLTDSMFAALPYGFADCIDMEGLEPGMKVKMQITPQTRWVNYITVQRQVVIGTAVRVSPEDETVELNTGVAYRLFPGARIFRDGAAVDLKAVQAGDYVVGQPLPDSSQWLQLDAFSAVVYGRVIYFNENNQILYVFNKDNQIQECKFTGKTRAFRRGSLMIRPAFEPGSWVRVFMSGQGSEALRLDSAETSERSEKTLLKYDAVNQMFTMTDGSVYQWLPSTLVSSGGCAVEPEDMIAGRPVWVTTLAGDAIRSCLAAIEAYRDANAPLPVLNVKASVLNGTLILQGKSDTDQIAVYRRDGRRVSLQPDADGGFNLLMLEDSAENTLRVVAVNSINGAVINRDIAIESYQPPASPALRFTDIEHSPAKDKILRLAEQGVLSGYDDGAFRPYAAISRLELVGLICRSLNLFPQGGWEGTRFMDQEQIPWWGIGLVQAARENGLIEGYDDNTFRPLQPATRSEMALLMDRIYEIKDKPGSRSLTPPQDIPAVPHWAKAAVARGYERGAWPAAWQSAFKPHSYLSREEAVLILSGLRSEE
ncbi:MAG: S8 family serine peptidase [Syntrophomonadaceae bacterium]